MAEIVESLGGAERERIGSLREGGRFFWIDLDTAEATPERLEEILGINNHASGPLLDFGRSIPPSRKFHADGEHVVFPFQVFLEAEPVEEGIARLDPIEVHVLVHGDYLLTVHRESTHVPEILAGYTPEGRSEQYVVYAVLDGMVATAFDALNNVQVALEQLELATGTEGGTARVRMATLREISARLVTMRRQLAPLQGIFERISQEITHVKGLEPDSEGYFDRIHAQLHRLIDGIDAASSSMAQLIDLRLNETMYWLTVVATIFLPLTFVTGFFGMNFDWLVNNIHSTAAFFLLGVGVPLLLTLLTYMLIQRRGRPVERDPNSIERAVGTVRRTSVGLATAAVRSTRTR